MSLLKDKIELEIGEAELLAQKQVTGLPPVYKWIVIVCAIAFIPGYFIAKAVTTNLALKKYQQSEVTAHASFSSAKELITPPATVTSQKPGSYAAILQISNLNLELSLDKVPYQVNFYNSQKQKIYSYSDELFLLPNQTKYLAVPTFNIKDEIAYSELQLPDPLPWQRRLSIPTVNITQSSPTYTQQALPPAFVISGDFSNQTPYQLKKVRLVFVLYDGNGKIIDSSQRDEFSVNPFERRSYTQLWPNINGSNVAKADIKIYTDNLDPQNLVAPQIPSGSSSDLGRPTFNR